MGRGRALKDRVKGRIKLAIVLETKKKNGGSSGKEKKKKKVKKRR